MIATDTHIIKEIHKNIEKELSRIGILYRVFSRVKSEDSLDKKLKKEAGKYSKNGKKIQDIFGVRVALYFPDDTKITQAAIENIFEYDRESSSIDNPNTTSFEATRYNLVFKLSDTMIDESILCKNKLVDETFEVQLRTVLSEGWHEVEHDLRYKHNDDWKTHDDLNRALNGIYASLETADWSMMKLFEELAYRHYKHNEWEQMLRTKFRLRFIGVLGLELKTLFDAGNEIAKQLFQIERTKIIKKITEKNIHLPLNYDNLVYIVNYYYIKDEELLALTPVPVLSHLAEREHN